MSDSDWVPDSLADENESVVMNPSAIGNPDEEPVVFVGSALLTALNPCRHCGRLNGFHRDACRTRSATKDGQP